MAKFISLLDLFGVGGFLGMEQAGHEVLPKWNEGYKNAAWGNEFSAGRMLALDVSKGNG